MATKQETEQGEDDAAVPDMAEMAASMIADLFRDSETVLYSNAAVAGLIDGLLGRYKVRAVRRDRLALLRHWKKDAVRLKSALKEAAKEDSLLVEDGEEVPHMNEQATRGVLDRICPADPYLPAPRRQRRGIR